MLFEVKLLCLVALFVGRTFATNIIFILADDLGFGDLGFSPFSSEEFKGIKTPHLQRLAASGLTLTNFHTASPVCSPSRVSILTGLFPWRVGVDFIYSQDKKLDGSEELDHEQLPLLANIPMTLRDQGFYTAHVGKWHLGGITPADMEARQQGNCSIPGINQYGFSEYVTMTEGFNSMRAWTHKNKNTYSKGADFLYKDDAPLPNLTPTPILTNRQTDEAIRIIREQAVAKRPFFLNIWYDAPHSPWEPIEPYFSSYQNSFSSDIQRRYASMISNMDENIGRILDEVEALRLAEDTLIFFTSDNGPEMDVGSPGPYRGHKRLVTEGGIRIPAIASWKGKIAPSSTTDAFLLTTDLFPTFVAAAKVQMPSNIRIDGFSFLPALLDRSKSIQKKGDERIVLWYTHSLGYPKFTAARAFGYKVLWADYEGRRGKNLPPSWRIFDMVNDPLESTNILSGFQAQCEAANKLSLLPANEKLSWENIVDHKVDPHGLNLVRFLEIAMYLFRFEGERSWLTYHDQKPAETTPSCSVRGLKDNERLPPFSHVLQPNFCGKSLWQAASTGCVCEFSDCEQRWKYAHNNVSAIWAESLVYNGVAHYAPTKGTLSAHIHNVLKWTHYNGVCPVSALLPIYDAVTRSSLPQLTAVQSQCLDTTRLHDHLGSATRKNTEAESAFAFGDFVGNEWRRSCHQRVHFDDLTGHYYLVTTTCAQDMPAMTVNIGGMPRPVNICPESLERLMSPLPVENFMDDNILLGIFNLVLLSIVGAKGEEDIVLRPKPVRDTAIIDPLFLHFVGVDDPDVTGAFKSWKPQQIQQRLDKLWGFLHDFERRWAGQCQHDCLEYSIWPWHVQEHFWGATVAHHSLKDPSHLQLIHIYPAVKEKDADNKHLNDHAAKIVTAFVQEAITRARNATSAAEPLTVTTHILHSTFSGLIPSLETMKVIVLVKLAVRAFQQSQGRPLTTSIDAVRSLEKKLKLNSIFSERKKLIDFIIFQGRDAFQQRKKTLRFMSSPKFN